MTEKDVHELIGLMVLRMREAEMRIAELEVENAALKASKEKKK